MADFLIFFYKKTQREVLPSWVAYQDHEVEGDFGQPLAMFDDTKNM